MVCRGRSSKGLYVFSRGELKMKINNNVTNKPQDFYKIREDIRRKRKKRKVVTAPEMFCIRTVNLLSK